MEGAKRRGYVQKESFRNKLQQGNVMNIKRNDALTCSERQIVLEDP